MSVTSPSTRTTRFCQTCNARERVHVDGVCVVCANRSERRYEVILERSDSGWTSATVLAWHDGNAVGSTCVAMVGPFDPPAAHDAVLRQGRSLAETLDATLIDGDEVDRTLDQMADAAQEHDELHGDGAF